jgi:hypothetical protein
VGDGTASGAQSAPRQLRRTCATIAMHVLACSASAASPWRQAAACRGRLGPSTASAAMHGRALASVVVVPEAAHPPAALVGRTAMHGRRPSADCARALRGGADLGRGTARPISRGSHPLLRCRPHFWVVRPTGSRAGTIADTAARRALATSTAARLPAGRTCALTRAHRCMHHASCTREMHARTRTHAPHCARYARSRTY